MAEPVRVDRHGFLSKISEPQTPFGRTVYSARRTTDKGDNRLPFIKVVFDMAWPDDTLAGDTPLADTRRGALGAIFRVKSLLEGTLSEPLEVEEIIVGCVTVKYGVPGDLSPRLIATAAKRLWESRHLFSVTDVKANADGKAIQIK